MTKRPGNEAGSSERQAILDCWVHNKCNISDTVLELGLQYKLVRDHLMESAYRGERPTGWPQGEFFPFYQALATRLPVEVNVREGEILGGISYPTLPDDNLLKYIAQQYDPGTMRMSARSQIELSNSALKDLIPIIRQKGMLDVKYGKMAVGKFSENTHGDIPKTLDHKKSFRENPARINWVKPENDWWSPPVTRPTGDFMGSFNRSAEYDIGDFKESDAERFLQLLIKHKNNIRDASKDAGISDEVADALRDETFRLVKGSYNRLVKAVVMDPIKPLPKEVIAGSSSAKKKLSQFPRKRK